MSKLKQMSKSLKLIDYKSTSGVCAPKETATITERHIYVSNRIDEEKETAAGPEAKVSEGGRSTKWRRGSAPG